MLQEMLGLCFHTAIRKSLAVANFKIKNDFKLISIETFLSCRDVEIGLLSYSAFLRRCVIRRLSACTRTPDREGNSRVDLHRPHREGNSMGGSPQAP